MNHLPESQQLVIMFLAGMLSRSPSIVEELDKAVQSDFLIPAEVCMARPEWKEKEIFNLDEVTELHTKAARPPALEGPPPPVAEPTVAADVNASVEASANAGQVETAEQSASQWLPGGMEPEQQAAQRTVTEHFPHLVLSDSQCDMLKRVSAEKLEAVLTHARVRAGRNISIIVGEPLTADFHGMDRADKRTHLLVWDVKAASTNTSDNGLGKPWRYTPPYAATQTKALGKVMKTCFGKSKDEVEEQDRLMRPNDMAIFLDGRVPTVQRDIKKQLTANLKGLPTQFTPTRQIVPFEFFYDNHEWVVDTQAMPGRCSRSRFHACMPTHVEVGFAVIGKDFEVETRERRWLGLPGSNRSRGWSGNSLQDDGHHIYVTRATLAQMYPEKQISEKMESGSGSEAGEVDLAEKVIAWPWQAPESFWKEFFNSVADGSKLVVFSSTPAGPACLAAARLGATYMGWVPNTTQRSVLMEFCILHIALDLVCGNRDWGHRFLSRAQSLAARKPHPHRRRAWRCLRDLAQHQPHLRPSRWRLCSQSKMTTRTRTGQIRRAVEARLREAAPTHVRTVCTLMR